MPPETNATFAGQVPSAADSIATIEALRGTRVLLFAPNDGISPACFEQVTAAVLALPRNTRVEVIVHSYGGLAGAAFKIARMLQQFEQGFTAIVPRRAKSAATLLCLGAKQILMTEGAELGPIDTQMPHPHEPDERISALEGMKGLEAVSGFCHRFLHETMLLVLGQTGRSVKDSLQLATEFAAPVVRPLFEQIDPMDLGKYKRALEIGQEYAQRLLKSAGGYSDEQASSISEKLVNGYPEHGFVIDAREAKELGLRAETLDNITGLLALAVVAEIPTGHHIGFLDGGTPIATLLPKPAPAPQAASVSAVTSNEAMPQATAVAPVDGGGDGAQRPQPE